MTSSDYAQIGTLIHRLDQARKLCDPATLLQAIAHAISVTAEPLPGNPRGIEDIATAFGKAGRETDPIVTGLHKLGHSDLPVAWQSDAATTASQVVVSTGDLLSHADPAFTTAAKALDDYAASLRTLERERGHAYQRFHDAMHKAGALNIGGYEIPLDPAAVVKLCYEVVDLIDSCVHIYNRYQNAADLLVSQLADVAGKARAGAAVKKGMNPAEAVFLADLTFGPNGSTILSNAQLTALSEKISKLSPADRAKLDALLKDAKSPQEQAYILKGLAAGNNLSALTTFANTIRGKQPDWLTRHLSLVDPNSPKGEIFYDDGKKKVRIEQTSKTTCGSASIVLAHAMNDPLYSLQLTGTGGNDSTAAFTSRLAVEEQQVHNSTNPNWPQAWGTTPWGETAGMNKFADPGANYHTVWVDDTDGRSVYPALRNAVQAVDAGHTVPVLVTPTAQQGVHGAPLHYVLMVGHEGSNLTFYDPSGYIRQIPEADFLNGRMTGIDPQLRHVTGVSLPGGR